MIKVVENEEYLDYGEAAKQYGFSKSTMYIMVHRHIFSSKKFSNDNKAYIAKKQLEAYKYRKLDEADKEAIAAHQNTPVSANIASKNSGHELAHDEREVPKDTNFIQDLPDNKRIVLVTALQEMKLLAQLALSA